MTPAEQVDDSDARWFTVREVADHLRVSRMTVYRMVQAGEIEAIHIRRGIRIPVAAVRRLLQEGTP